MDSALQQLPYLGSITITNVEFSHQIVVIGTTFSAEEAKCRRNAVCGLLAAHYLNKTETKDVCQDLYITHSGHGSQLCRAELTDQNSVEDDLVKVLLVDEGGIVLKDLQSLAKCPTQFSERKFPAIYKQYILADVYPISHNFSEDVICWLKATLEHKKVTAVFRDTNQRFSFINPLDANGTPVIATLVAKGKVAPQQFPDMRLCDSSMVLSKEAETKQPLQELSYSVMRIPLNTAERCYVLSVENGPWRFCLQFEQQRAMLNEVNSRLQLLSQSKTLLKIRPKVGDAVICKSMQQHYRGLVLRTTNREINVYCVDKGITMSKTLEEIWMFPRELFEIPVLTYTCCLHNLPASPDDEIKEQFSLLISNCYLFGQVVTYKKDITAVSLFVDCASLLYVPPVLTNYMEAFLPDKCKAIISYVHEEAAIVYLQLVEHEKELAAMHEELQTQSVSEPLDHTITKGLPCLALYPEDGYWYRGSVVHPGDPLIVNYVDHGNEATVPAEFVRKLDLNFVNRLPAQAIPCVLNKVTKKPLKLPDIIEVIEDYYVNVFVVGETDFLLGENSLKAYIVELSSSRTSASLNKFLSLMESTTKKETSSSVPSEFINGFHETSCIKPPRIHINCFTKKDCIISSAQSPSDFYLTLVENESIIQDLKRSMKEALHKTQNKIGKVQQGWMVAYHGQDQQWHRAVITSCRGYSVDLFLIDSGMKVTGTTHEVRKLPDSVLTVPAQAVNCMLENILTHLNNVQSHDSLQQMIGHQVFVSFIADTGEKWKVNFNIDLQSPVTEVNTPSKDEVAVEDKAWGRWNAEGEKNMNNCDRSRNSPPGGEDVRENGGGESQWRNQGWRNERTDKYSNKKWGSLADIKEKTNLSSRNWDKKDANFTSRNWDKNEERNISRRNCNKPGNMKNDKNEPEIDYQEKQHAANWLKANETHPTSVPEANYVADPIPEDDTILGGTPCSDDEPGKLPALILPFDEPLDIEVTWILSPVKFYCRVNNCLTNSWWEQIEAAQKYYNGMSADRAFHTFAPDQMVMAMTPEGMWHRGKVILISAKSITIQYMDFGTIYCVQQSQAILPLKKEHVEMFPPMGFCVILPNIKQSADSVWPLEERTTAMNFLKDVNQCVLKRQCHSSDAYIATEVMANGNNYEEFLLSKGLAIETSVLPDQELERAVTSEVTTVDDEAHTFEVTFEVTSVNDEAHIPLDEEVSFPPRAADKICSKLVSDVTNIGPLDSTFPHQDAYNNNLVTKDSDFILQVPLKSGGEVYLTNVEGDGKIWLQRGEDSGVLMELEGKIEQYSSRLKAASKIEIGLLCVVKSLYDAWFYRASVKNICKQEVEVLCVDFGFTETLPSSQVFEMPEELKKMAPIGYRCILDHPGSSDRQTLNWNTLYESNCNQVLSVEVVSTSGETSIVHLFNMGRNIACFPSNPPEKPQSLEGFLKQDNKKARSNYVTNNSLDSSKIPEVTVDANTGKEFQEGTVDPKFDLDENMSVDVQETDQFQSSQFKEESLNEHFDQTTNDVTTGEEFQESIVYPNYDSDVFMSADDMQKTEKIQSIQFEEESSKECIDQATIDIITGEDFQESIVYPNCDSDENISVDMQGTDKFKINQFEEESAEESIAQVPVDAYTDDEFPVSIMDPKFELNKNTSRKDVKDVVKLQNALTETPTASIKYGTANLACDLKSAVSIKGKYIKEVSGNLSIKTQGIDKATQVHLKHVSEDSQINNDFGNCIAEKIPAVDVSKANYFDKTAEVGKPDYCSMFIERRVGNLSEVGNKQYKYDEVEEKIYVKYIKQEGDMPLKQSPLQMEQEMNVMPRKQSSTLQTEEERGFNPLKRSTPLQTEQEGDFMPLKQYSPLQTEQEGAVMALKQSSPLETEQEGAVMALKQSSPLKPEQESAVMALKQSTLKTEQEGDVVPLKQSSPLQTEQEGGDMPLKQSSLQTEQEGDIMPLKQSSPLQSEHEGNVIPLKQSSPLQNEQEGDVIPLKQSSPLQNEQVGDVMALKQSSPLQNEQEGDVMALKQSSPIQSEHEGNVIPLKQSSPLQSEQEGDVMPLKQSSPLQREHEGNVIPLKQSSPLQNEQEGDVIPLKQSSPLQNEQEGDVMALKQSSPIQSEHEGNVIPLKQSSPLQSEQEGDVIPLRQSSPLQSEQEGDVIPLKQSSPFQNELEGDVIPLKQSSPLQSEQEGDVMLLKQSSPLQAEQKRDVMALKQSSPLQSEQVGDVIPLKQSSPFQNELEGDVIPLKQSSPLQSEQVGDVMTLKQSSPLQTEQERDVMPLKQSSPLQTERERDVMALKQSSPLQSEQESDVRPLKQFLSLLTEQERDVMPLKQSSPLQTEEERDFMSLKQSSPLQSEQERDVMPLKQSSPLQTEEERDFMSLKQSSPLQSEQEREVMPLKRFLSLQTEQERDVMPLKQFLLLAEQERDVMPLKQSSPLQTEEERDFMSLKQSSLQSEQESDDMPLKQSSPLQTEQERDVMPLKQSSPLQSEQEGDVMALKQSSPLQSEQVGDVMPLKQSSPLQTEQERDVMPLKQSSPLQTKQERDVMALKQSSPLQSEQESDVRPLKQFLSLVTEQERDVMPLKQFLPMQIEQERDVMSLKQSSPLETEEEMDFMSLNQSSPLQTEEERDFMSLKQSSPLQTDEERDFMPLKQSSPLQTEEERDFMSLNQSSQLQTEEERDFMPLKQSSLQTEIYSYVDVHKCNKTASFVEAKVRNILGINQDENVPRDIEILHVHKDFHLVDTFEFSNGVRGVSEVNDGCDDSHLYNPHKNYEDVLDKSMAADVTSDLNMDMKGNLIVDDSEGSAESLCVGHFGQVESPKQAAKDTTASSELCLKYTGLKSQCPLTNGAAVYISFLNGEDSVWLQRHCDTDKIYDMSRRISISVNSAQVPNNIYKDKIYLVQHEDQMWYRAQILEELQYHVLACFIDYGNSQVIATQHIREIPADLLEDGPFGYECILKEQAVFVENVSSPSLLETYLDKELSVAFVDAEMKTLTLQIDGQNILDGVLQLISSLDQAYNKAGFGTGIEQLHNKQGTVRYGGQVCTEKEIKFSQGRLCNGEGSVSKREEALSINILNNRNEKESSRCSAVHKEHLWNKAGLKIHTEQFTSETLFASPFTNVQRVCDSSFNSEEKQLDQTEIDRSVVVTMPVINPIPRSSKSSVEAFLPYRKVYGKSSLHAIQEVEENETIDTSELKVKPFHSLLVHVEEFPFCLWIQKKEDMDLADYISSTLVELGDNLVLLDAPQVDMVCVSLLYGCHQRGQVMALTSDEATLHFIDHGKYGTVALNKLWKLPDDFLDIPPLVSQIFLPVKVIPGRESGAVLAVAEACLHSVCACLDLNQLSGTSSRITHTLVSAPGIGDLGELLVSNELARPINWGNKFELKMTLLVKRMLKASTNELCNDSHPEDLLLVTPSIEFNEKLNELAKELLQ